MPSGWNPFGRGSTPGNGLTVVLPIIKVLRIDKSSKYRTGLFLKSLELNKTYLLM
jgi:hypothetical protein